MDKEQRDRAKREVGVAAAQLIHNDMLVGLGTGSTSAFFIEALAKRVKEGLNIEAVATSRHSDELARSLEIPMRSLEEVSVIDITVDGADQIDPKKQMIKGGGGALVREKILAASSREMVVIVDSDKWQDRLVGVPLPIELAVFAYHTTLRRLNDAGFKGALRMEKERPYITDNGNMIFEMPIEIPIDDAANLHARLKSLVGVIDTGLFFGMAGRVLISSGDGRVEVR